MILEENWNAEKYLLLPQQSSKREPGWEEAGEIATHQGREEALADSVLMRSV
jgi:hypothetical protein